MNINYIELEDGIYFSRGIITLMDSIDMFAECVEDVLEKFLKDYAIIPAQ